MARNQQSTDEDVTLNNGTVISQSEGIQVIAYKTGDYEQVRRYVDVDNTREVLRIKEQQKQGVSSILKVDRKYWDITVDEVNVGESEFDLETPYVVNVLIGDRLIEIITQDEETSG